MKKLSKLALIPVIAITFSSFASLPAKAADTTFTFNQFSESAGYKELQSAMDDFARDFVLAKSGSLRLITNSDAGEVVIGRYDALVTTNSNSTRIQISNADELMGSEMVDDYGVSNGKFFGSFESYENHTGITNTATVLSRLGKKNATLYKSDSETALSSVGLNSSAIDTLTMSYMESWNQMQLEFQPTATFSEVTTSANSINPADTDYGFDFQFTSQLSNDPCTGNVQITLTADGNHYSAITRAKVPYFGGIVVDLVISSTVEINPDQVVEVPNLDNAVDLKSFISMKSKIGAEAASNKKAKTMVTKAKALATKAKQAVSSNHLVQAAKSLKYTYTNIKNGLKLSSKVAGVSGSVCVTVVKKVIQTKTC